MRYEIYNCNDFEQLAKVCEIAKVPYRFGVSRGYSQGEWSEVLIVQTPDYLETTGCKELTRESMEEAFKLFGYWAWGDVYYYMIEKDGEMVESRGGFYGDDEDESGLFGHAKQDIDNIISQRNKRKFERLKQLIKNSVELIYRPTVLQKF